MMDALRSFLAPSLAALMEAGDRSGIWGPESFLWKSFATTPG